MRQILTSQWIYIFHKLQNKSKTVRLPVLNEYVSINKNSMAKNQIEIIVCH